MQSFATILLAAASVFNGMALAAPTESTQDLHARGCDRTHTVVSGEYCYLIATKYGLSVQQLEEKNRDTANFSCNNLWIGLTLCV